jgi:potassium/hydrogen antiporter
VELNFPKNALIAMIKRKEKYITPNGSTVIEANDKLIVLSENQQGIDAVFDCLDISQEK